MANYLVLYRSSVSAIEQMADSTPEQAAAGMQAWMEWAQRAGDAVVDLGTPLSNVDPAEAMGDPVAGYSILRADSDDQLRALLGGHPHTASGGTVEVLRALALPGM